MRRPVAVDSRPATMPASLYEVLGVPTDATGAQVRAAYRRSALLHHPDKGGDSAAFARCAEAYAVLSDAPRRAAYDRLGDAALVGLQVDVEAALAEVFETGGLFEQLVGADDSLAAMVDEGDASMESMQLSFASFMRHAMGGGDGGPVLLPDGSLCSAPRVKMPSLADLMEGVDDPEELAMMELVARKMGVGGRGALVAGTGLQALGVLQRLGEDPGLWSDEEDDDGYLDELQGELRAKAHPATAASPTALSLPPPRALAEDALLSRYASDGGDGGVGGVCTAPALKAKAWLDAAREGRLDVMKQALEEEPSLLFLRGVGLKQTAQHWAAGKGHVRMLRWLLHCGAAVDAANANGHTALHAAAAAGQPECCDLLASRGAALGREDEDGRTASQLAAANGHAQIAAALAPSDASPPPPAGRPRGRMQREVRREEVGAEELPPLLAAAAKGDVAALRAALDGADVRMCDEGGRGATHLAARGGHAACLRALIEAGAPMDALTSKGNSAVAVAAKHRQWAAAVLLLDHGAKGDALALLHAARGAESVDARGVQLRLCAAGGMWPGDSDGVDALMLAAAAGDGGAVARLLELRADPRAVDHRGMSPLHHCAGKGDCRCATILVEASASLHASDQSGDTPLHIAGRRGHAELYGLLLDAGADRSAENARGRPAKLLDATAECCVM